MSVSHIYCSSETEVFMHHDNICFWFSNALAWLGHIKYLSATVLFVRFQLHYTHIYASFTQYSHGDVILISRYIKVHMSILDENRIHIVIIHPQNVYSFIMSAWLMLNCILPLNEFYGNPLAPCRKKKFKDALSIL